MKKVSRRDDIGIKFDEGSFDDIARTWNKIDIVRDDKFTGTPSRREKKAARQPGHFSQSGFDVWATPTSASPLPML